MMEKTTEIKKQLSKLFIKSLGISKPLYQLEVLRQRLEGRGLQPFDQDDILVELGSMQRTLKELNSEMLHLYDLIKQS